MHNILTILFKAPLNNTTPRVIFLQNQQPVTANSMNPLLLPFWPKPNHQTHFLMQDNPKTSSPQGTYCIVTRGNSQNRFQCLTCLKPSHVIYICWSTESHKLQCLFNPQNLLTRNSCEENSSCNPSFKFWKSKKYVVCLKSNTNLDIWGKCNVVYIVIKHSKLSSIRNIKIVVQQLPD